MATRTPRLLVATRHSPFPEHDGAGAYLYDLVSFFDLQGTEVHIAWLKPDGAYIRRGWCWVPLQVAAVAKLHLPGAWEIGRLRIFPAMWWLPFKARWLHRTKSVLQAFGLFRHKATKPSPPPALSSGHAWSAPPSMAEATFFERIARKLRPETVLANYCWLTPLFALSPSSRLLVLTHDVSSHRLPLTGSLRHDLAVHSNPGTAAGESALLGRADGILAISAEDAAVFRAMQPTKAIFITPKSSPVLRPAVVPVPGRCLFVGGPNLPNAEGLRWFLSEIWPRVREAEPHAHLHICGAISQTVISPPEGVVLRGRVGDLTPEYAAAEVVVIPLLRGTGVKIKLIEAASYGKACVTTPVGLQGLSCFSHAVLVAEQAEAFAQAVIQLLQDANLRKTLGTQVHSVVNNHFSPEACFGEVHDWLNEKREQRSARAYSHAFA